MGGDGGSIPRRCEMVKEKKEPEKRNKDQDMVGKWQHCTLSGQVLVKPIMSCRLGRYGVGLYMLFAPEWGHFQTKRA